MSFGDILGAVGLVASAAGIATSIIGSNKAEDALERQAASIESLSVEEAAFIKRQAEIEAGLIEAQGADEAEVLAFNEAVARENAQWERMAGTIAFDQAKRRWENQVKTVVATFGASGTRIAGGSNDAVVQEQIAEMEKDLFVIGLNAERAAGQQEQQADLFSLRRRQTDAAAQTRSAARLEIGEIESGVAGTTAAARADAARTSARTASITGFGSAFAGASSLLSEASRSPLFA